MGGDRAAHGHRRLDLTLDEFKAFQLHLPPPDIERGDDLVIRAGRSVGHVGFVKALFDLALEILIVDMDHRPLPERGQRLVRRLCGVNPHPRRGRRDQSGFQQRRLIVILQLFGLFGMGLGVFGRPQPFTQHIGGVHAGTLAVGRAEAGEGKPRLVPEEDQVGLDGEAFLHHPLDVIDDAVESAVGQQKHPDLVELARRLQLQKLVLDLPQRHRTIHRVFVQRIAVEVTHLRAGQHHTVMVRLVAVAVDQHDIPRPDQRLHDDLVAGRGAVGGKEGLLRPEGAGRVFLRLLDRPGRFQKAVEPARCRRCFGQEDVGAIKGAHVLNPVRTGNGLAPADRHRMEDAGGLFGIFHQRGEERRLEP